MKPKYRLTDAGNINIVNFDRTEVNPAIHPYGKFVVSLLPRELEAALAIEPPAGLPKEVYVSALARLMQMQECISNPLLDETFSTALCRCTAAIMGRECEGDDDEEHYKAEDQLLSEVVLQVAHEHRAAAKLDPEEEPSDE